MPEEQVFKIDIDEVLRSKMGKRACLVPSFLRRWLKNIAHQEEINQFMEKIGGLEGVPWLDAAVEYVGLKLDVRGIENLPDDTDGSLFTFVCNHPLGGPDGIAIGKILGHRYDGRIRYLVNDLLMNLHGLAPLCVPINKTGSQSRDFPAMVEAAFASRNHIIMFPAGICSRRINGEIHDIPWKKTFVTKSRATGRVIVPIHFSGRNSERFYRWANFGKRLGLKFNIAMLLLADETFRHRGETFTVTIGKPIGQRELASCESPRQCALMIEEKVYELSKQP